MKKILAFKGSPRINGNSRIMLEHFVKGAKINDAVIEEIDVYKINITYCHGCLRCNVLRRCQIENDDWQELSKKILEADILVFASPVYFHHLPAPLKMIIDRFRSFMHIMMTEDGLIHTPWQEWDKDFVLLLSMGTIQDIDAQPIVDLFEFMRKELGMKKGIHTIKSKRLAMAKQIELPEKKLSILYKKLRLPEHLVPSDYLNNQKVLEDAYNLGVELTIQQSKS